MCTCLRDVLLGCSSLPVSAVAGEEWQRSPSEWVLYVSDA